VGKSIWFGHFPSSYAEVKRILFGSQKKSIIDFHDIERIVGIEGQTVQLAMNRVAAAYGGSDRMDVRSHR
jgi:hypothetical protein